MRFSMMSIAAFGFASVALAAPAALEKKDHRNYGVKTKVVTETTTVTYSSTPLVFALGQRSRPTTTLST